MERYLVDVTNLRLDSQQQQQTSPDGTPKARMYLAAPVDARIAELERGLKDLMFAYVRLMESGRDRIVSLGGDCDPVDVMERGDPYLRKARELMVRESQ